jgi:hypothetical protein
MTTTPLDEAYARMTQAPDDDTARLRFYERLADSELRLLLVKEAGEEAVDPLVFETEGHNLVLAFDTDERLAEFAKEEAPYAALPGRVLAEMLAGSGLGLALNPEVAPSATVLPAEAMVWLNDTLSEKDPGVQDGQIAEVFAPKGVPEPLLSALNEKLARAEGLASAAYLVGVRHRDDSKGHLLCVIGAHPDAQDALARAINEALVFSGLDAGTLDVTFFEADHPIVVSLDRVGLRFDLPKPPLPDTPIAPGSDPDQPPKLR